MVCTLLVPKAMSKSNNSCPFHTCQTLVAWSFLWRLWRAAAPLPAEKEQKFWSQQQLCAPSSREGKVEMVPSHPLCWLRTWCDSPGCCLPSSAYNISVCGILASEQSMFENTCSEVYAIYFCMNQALLLTVPAWYRTGKSHRNNDGRSCSVIPLSLPRSHRCLAKSWTETRLANSYF